MPTGALQEWDWILERHPGHVVAANNKAVMTMYACDTAGAIRAMEANLAAHPIQALLVGRTVEDVLSSHP